MIITINILIISITIITINIIINIINIIVYIIIFIQITKATRMFYSRSLIQLGNPVPSVGVNVGPQ